MQMPIASAGSSVDSFYYWLKKKVEETDYGEVGITFIIHNKSIVRVKERLEISTKAPEEKK